MDDPLEFRDIFHKDEYGYITNAQLNLFLCRPNGEQMVATGHTSFKTYMTKCRVHNYLYDIMVEDEKMHRPPRVTMYWNDKKEAMSYSITDKDVRKDIKEIQNYAWEDKN